MPEQPYLHEHVTCLRAPATWLSPRHGQLRGGVDGLYVADRRVLSRLEVRVGGAEPVPLRADPTAAEEVVFFGIVRNLGDPGPDPTVWCERTRRVSATGGTETIALRNASRAPIATEVTIAVAADLVPVGAVKAGQPGVPLPPRQTADGLEWRAADGLAVSFSALSGKVRSDDPSRRTFPESAVLVWRVEVPAGGMWSVRVEIRVAAPATGGFRPVAPAGPAPWAGAPLRVRADDRRLDALVRAGVADLGALLLADPADVADMYPAGGSPWYLTLFGRDALWTSLLALPLGTELAGGTLRTLARRQGTRHDPVAEEAPGKIPHELRPVDAAVGLPPVYYGTVDATPLFVVLLARAWRWGMPAAEVAALLTAAERALDWLASHGDRFIQYQPSGTGLANQGWKDSGDGIQHADGRLAMPPVALAEVQAYAYRAARDGADLLDAFGRPDGDRWRGWAAGLAGRFRAAFWVVDGADAAGAYPAIALEAGKSTVDGPASNMGHLLGTGLLAPAEERLVARRLAGPALAGSYGLRTLATTAAGFNPLSYHGGSIWPHDTAIALLGLVRSGHAEAARGLLEGLLAAGAAVDYRLPELYGGQSGRSGPVPYPAACRPQAWAAATGPALVQALLGLDADVPAGRVTVRPMAPSPVGAYEVRGIRLGAAGTLDVRVGADGVVIDMAGPPGLVAAAG